MKNYRLNKIRDNFVRAWTKFLDLVRKVVMLFTFVIMCAGVVYASYYIFISYNVVRAMSACVLLYTMAHINLRLQE